MKIDIHRIDMNYVPKRIQNPEITQNNIQIPNINEIKYQNQIQNQKIFQTVYEKTPSNNKNLSLP